MKFWKKFSPSTQELHFKQYHFKQSTHWIGTYLNLFLTVIANVSGLFPSLWNNVSLSPLNVRFAVKDLIGSDAKLL